MGDLIEEFLENAMERGLAVVDATGKYRGYDPWRGRREYDKLFRRYMESKPGTEHSRRLLKRVIETPTH